MAALLENGLEPHPLAVSFAYIDDSANGGVDLYASDTAMQEEVRRLVEAEMALMNPSMYLELAIGESKVNGELFEQNSALRAEYERVASGGVAEKLQPKEIGELSTVMNADEAEQRRRIETAQMLLEEQKLHLTNLELLERYGRNAWKLHAADMDGFANSWYNVAREKAFELEKLNQDRRLAQEKERKKVHALNYEFYELADRNRCMRAELNTRGGVPKSKRLKLS